MIEIGSVENNVAIDLVTEAGAVIELEISSAEGPVLDVVLETEETVIEVAPATEEGDSAELQELADFDFAGGAAPEPGWIDLVAPDGSSRRVAEDIQFPNGMVVTPDGGTLVVPVLHGVTRLYMKTTLLRVSRTGGLGAHHQGPGARGRRLRVLRHRRGHGGGHRERGPDARRAPSTSGRCAR